MTALDHALRKYVDRSPYAVAVWRLGRKRGLMLCYVNAAFGAQVGVDISSQLGAPADAIFPEDAPAIGPRVLAALRGGRAEDLGQVVPHDARVAGRAFRLQAVALDRTHVATLVARVSAPARGEESGTDDCCSLEGPAAAVRLSHDLRIEATSGAFARLLGRTGESLVGVRWSELTPPVRLGLARGLLAAAREGAVERFDLDVAGVTGKALTLSVRACRSKGGEGSLELEVQAARPASSPRGAASYTYLVRLLADGASLVEYGDRRCHREIHASDAPCTICPLKDLPFGSRVRVRPVDGGHGVELVTARGVGPELAEVTVIEAPKPTLDAITRARLDELAERAGLTERECTVLTHLAVGARGPADVAALLGVSLRTVRFHQYNALKKLGADSVLDLLQRLL